MKTIYKTLLSIPSLLVIAFFSIFLLFPQNLSLITNNLGDYNLIIISLNLLVFFSLIILIRIIWRLNNITKSEKWNWSLFLIFLQSLGILIFIWNKIDDLKELTNNSTKPTEN